MYPRTALIERRIFKMRQCGETNGIRHGTEFVSRFPADASRLGSGPTIALTVRRGAAGNRRCLHRRHNHLVNRPPRSLS